MVSTAINHLKYLHSRYMAATTQGLEQGGIPGRLEKGIDCTHTQEKG